MDLLPMGDLVPDWIYLQSGGPSAATALVLSSGEPVTYGQLSDRSARIAGGLAALDVGHGDRVAVLAANGLPTLEILLACARIGAVLVPLDHRLSEMDLSLVAADSGVAVLVYERAFVAGAWTVASATDCILVCIDSQGGGLSSYERLLKAEAVPPSPVSADHPWVILYRNHPNGTLKETALSHREILSESITAALSWAARHNGSPPPSALAFRSGKLDVCALASLLSGAE